MNDCYDAEEINRVFNLLASGVTAQRRLNWTSLYRVALAQFTVQLLHHTVTRGDDSRLLLLCCIGKPKVAPTVGPCEAKYINIVLEGSKAQRVSAQRRFRDLSIL